MEIPTSTPRTVLINGRRVDEKTHLANAGGIIGAYIESVNGSPQMAFERVGTTIERNVRIILEQAKNLNQTTREAGMQMAMDRVIMAMKAKGIWKKD